MIKGCCKVNKVESFSVFNEYSNVGIPYVLSEMVMDNKPVIVCIGSDLVLGDSLGPIVGTMLKDRSVDAFIYGTLSSPVTAKEVCGLRRFLDKVHPTSKIIAVDAAVGDLNDVGTIRVIKGGLKPGLGVNKNLGSVGDVSVIGVVAKKSQKNYDLFNATRLGLVYKMADKIATGIEEFLSKSTQKTYIKPYKIKSVLS